QPSPSQIFQSLSNSCPNFHILKKSLISLSFFLVLLKPSFFSLLHRCRILAKTIFSSRTLRHSHHFSSPNAQTILQSTIVSDFIY
ncbi:unnamed protein product, partial [Prunus brigantina]